MDIIQNVLIYQTQMMRNSSLGPYVPPDFSPPKHIVVVNALYYASLGVMILAAFIAMLMKHWLRLFERGLRWIPDPEDRAKTREFRMLGVQRWELSQMVELLPLLVQISLFLFAIGLVIFLFHISTPSFGVTIVIFGVGIFYYAMTTCISAISTSSPFRSSLSYMLRKMYRLGHALLCPSVEFFLSRAMDTTPATTLGRLRRRVQIFLHKSRPYQESTFASPIDTAPMDEIQVSTAKSALHRLYYYASNSRQSEELHWSVWQVAGSTAFRDPPRLEMPSWIVEVWADEEYFSNLPPIKLVAFVAMWLRTGHKAEFVHIPTIRAALTHNKHPLVQVVAAIFDYYLELNYDHFRYSTGSIPTEPKGLIRMVRRRELRRDQSIWLISTLSELCSEEILPRKAPYLIEICLVMLLSHDVGLGYPSTSDMILLEDVVTLAAIVCCGTQTDIITSSRKHPWMLTNIRNPVLFGDWFDNTTSDYHKPLISLLFLVVRALMYRESYTLAVQYLTIITAKGDLPLHTSALTAIAPTLTDAGLFAIGRMLVALPQGLELITAVSMFSDVPRTALPELLQNYDHLLGASEKPDPNICAILLVLSKHLGGRAISTLQSLNLDLKNPWLRLTARVVARLDIPDGSGLPIESFSDCRVHNMIAALSLLRYAESKVRVTDDTESLLLASFLQSREFMISFVALEYYTKTTISYSDPPAPSRYLSHAAGIVFNLMLPNHQLQIGWRILEIFVNGFDSLPLGWRQTFAESFFTLSRRRLPQQGDTGRNTSEYSQLEDILTWEYFHKEEQESEFTDSDFSGLDWMAMAWSLQLLQQSWRKAEGGAQSQDMSGPEINEEFVLRALCKLLDAAPYYQIIPIIPKLREFVQWFDDSDLPESRCTIATRVKEAVCWHERFHKFHCMWYI